VITEVPTYAYRTEQAPEGSTIRRLDASGRNPAPPDARRELFEALSEIARSGLGPTEQVASIGCSIKWNL
jgi:hypothetical protein